MDINEFISQLSEQFDETDPAELKPDTVLRELDDWSSVSVIMIIALVDSEYGVTLDSNMINQVQTIQELFDMVSSMQQNQ